LDRLPRDGRPRHRTVLSDSGYGPGAILVGHSQGGLVSRLAIRSDSVFGILTIGSPHAGTSLADAAGSINSYATTVSIASETARSGLDDEAFCDPFDDPICNDALDALDQLGFGFTPWQAAFAIGQAYTNTFDPDLAQLSPFSSVIADTLQTLYAGERAARRFSIQVEDDDEEAGPFRLTAPASVADPEMENMIITGVELALDGLGIATRADPENDPNYLEHEEAGDALSVMGPILDGFPYLWNDWVAHGFANDGAVPYASQVIPNALRNIPLSGFSHTEETSQAFLILSSLDLMRGL
jgi:PGAP1-like protein